MDPQVFQIAPAASKAMWAMLILPGLVLLLVCGVFVASAISARTARFEVSADGLRLRGDIYGRFIPANALDTAQARRVDLDATPQLEPQRRTMGTGLPGYRAGWFRLRNGESALLYLTDRSRAVYIPTTAGYSVMLSPENPDAFVSSLRRLTGTR